jgi:hypothetical protein
MGLNGTPGYTETASLGVSGVPRRSRMSGWCRPRWTSSPSVTPSTLDRVATTGGWQSEHHRAALTPNPARRSSYAAGSSTARRSFGHVSERRHGVKVVRAGDSLEADDEQGITELALPSSTESRSKVKTSRSGDTLYRRERPSSDAGELPFRHDDASRRPE